MRRFDVTAVFAVIALTASAGCALQQERVEQRLANPGPCRMQ